MFPVHTATYTDAFPRTIQNVPEQKSPRARCGDGRKRKKREEKNEENTRTKIFEVRALSQDPHPLSMTLDERQLCNGGVAMLVNVAARPRHPANCGHVRSELDSLWRCAEPRRMFPLGGTNLIITRICAEPSNAFDVDNHTALVCGGLIDKVTVSLLLASIHSPRSTRDY